MVYVSVNNGIIVFTEYSDECIIAEVKDGKIKGSKDEDSTDEECRFKTCEVPPPSKFSLMRFRAYNHVFYHIS